MFLVPPHCEPDRGEAREPISRIDGVDARHTRHLNTVRGLLEVQAARDAALHAEDPVVLAELRHLASSSNEEDLGRFHVVLGAASGNDVLATMLEDVLEKLIAAAGAGACCGSPATARRDHAALLDAVLGGRPTRAGELAHAHVAASHLAVVDGLLHGLSDESRTATTPPPSGAVLGRTGG